jgi:hypothetical protein
MKGGNIAAASISMKHEVSQSGSEKARARQYGPSGSTLARTDIPGFGRAPKLAPLPGELIRCGRKLRLLRHAGCLIAGF